MSVSNSFVLTGTSPAAPGTSVIATQYGLDQFTELVAHVSLIGATGGTLDVYLQSSVNWQAGVTGQVGTPAWYDVAHFTQLPAGATALRYIVSMSRGYPLTATIAVSNPTDGTPTMAANTLLPNILGNALRLIVVAGSLTTAGALITINCHSSEG